MLIPVAVTDLGKHWDFVRQGILATKEKVVTRWIPEDVYHDLRSGTAFLYLIADKGFCVLRQEKDTDGLCLHVWWLWCPGLWESKDEFVSALDDLARACRCVRIRAESPRAGFGLVGYFTEVCRTFEREVTHA